MLLHFFNFQKDNVPFKYVIIESEKTSPKKMYGKTFGDFSGDNFPDILISSAKDDGMHWYEYPSWTKHTIREFGSWSEDIQTGDMDGDGDIDIIQGNKDALFWYQNPLIQSKKSNTNEWNAIRIGSDGTNIHDLEVADINGDGKLDVVIRYEKENNKSVHIYIQETPTLFSEIEKVNTTNLKGEGLCLADINDDSFLDIIIGNVWCQNNGDGTKWKEQSYASELPAQLMIRVGDLNGNGANEILVCPQSSKVGSLVWFFQDVKSKVWKQQIIQNGITKMHGLAIGDFNLDGALDIHTSLRHDLKGNNDNVSIWINDNSTIPNFTEQILSKKGSHFSKVIDIGNDGDLDIQGVNWRSNKSFNAPIELWENLTINNLINE
ncbi:MAG: VCBS repeat-containing protein [Melioribacteraceae bacterium]